MPPRRKVSVVQAQEGLFGFDPLESPSHFVVNVPAGPSSPVEISEHLSWDPDRVATSVHYASDRTDGQVRARLPRGKWDEIAQPLEAEMNLRLRKSGRKPGRWKSGYNVLARLLGKEVTLLAWAIEDADPALTRVAVSNWLGLSPEERWWLYTMTAAATGDYVTGRNRGWRKAVRYALTENPVTGLPSSEPVVPEFFRLVSETIEPWGQRAVQEVVVATITPPVPSGRRRAPSVSRRVAHHGAR